MTTGVISHAYSSCGTVVIISAPDSLVLIPRVLAKEFDVDGKTIRFHYRRLRMPNPPGCVKGVPAELTDVTE